MPICFSKKFIFVHIPKTAGTSVSRRLGINDTYANFCHTDMKIKINECMCADNHVPAFFLKEMRPDIFEEYYKFTFVRNPYDRVISEFFWVYKGYWKEQFVNFSEKNIKNLFDVWLENYYLDKPSCRQCTQSWFLLDRDGETILVDDIFKFESFQSEFDLLIKKLNITPVEDKVYTKSKVKIDRNLLLTESHKEFIYNLFKEDFNRFGYPKEYIWIGKS